MRDIVNSSYRTIPENKKNFGKVKCDAFLVLPDFEMHGIYTDHSTLMGRGQRTSRNDRWHKVNGCQLHQEGWGRLTRVQNASAAGCSRDNYWLFLHVWPKASIKFVYPDKAAETDVKINISWITGSGIWNSHRKVPLKGMSKRSKWK